MIIPSKQYGGGERKNYKQQLIIQTKSRFPHIKFSLKPI